jgi:hypothetical protein
VVGYSGAGAGGRLGRADIEAPLELERIAIDDFTRKGRGELQR